MQYVEERIKPSAKKKDTRTWCKGKVGREHQWTEYSDLFPEMKWSRLLVRHCTVCTKRHLKFKK